MSLASDVLKHFNLFVDGRGYAGTVEEFTPPALKLKTESFRAGGMDTEMEIEQGMEKLECSFVLFGQPKDVLSQFGISAGETGLPLTARGSLESYDGTTTGVTLKMRGKVLSVESGAWKAGEASKLTVNMALTYYKREQGGIVLHEIDVPNMVRKIEGVDVLEQHRKNIGMDI